MGEMFKIAEWNFQPPAMEVLKDGRVRVTRNVVKTSRDDPGDVWRGEYAVMSESAYAAYVGAMEVEKRREAEIVDEYTMELIEEGVL